jgi:hypothetical protein
MDPRSSAYFAPQESGDGMTALGYGNGLGWLDWSQVPGFGGLADQMSAAENSVSGAGVGNLLTDALSASGNRLYEQQHGNNWVTRGIVDPQNNFVGEPQRFQIPDDRAFWNAALLAGAATGANVFAASGAAGVGATAAGGGTAGGAVAGGGLTAPAGFTMAPSLGASSAGVGASGVGGAAAGAKGMGWGQLAVQVGSSLAGSYLQSRAAEDAANMQAGVAREGIAEQRAQMERMRELLAPYVQAGTPALQGMQALIGQGGREGQTAQQAQQEAISAIEQSPLFQSQVRQGEDAMLQNASATGGLRGGNLQGALAQFRPAMLQQAIDQQYSRLAGLAGIGQQSAAGVGTAGINTGQNVAGLLQQQGAAMAGGVLGQAAPYANLLQMPMQFAGMQMAMGRNPFGGFGTQPAAQPTAQPVAGGGLRAPSGSSWFTPAVTTPPGP